jgi:hypothetical protein
MIVADANRQEAILRMLIERRGAILKRLEANLPDLRTYAFLQDALHQTNVASDKEYQRRFRGFYVVRRGSEWSEIFFGALERQKRSDEVTFPDVLRALFALISRVEGSFASKLVATINPKAPVLDSYVLANLGISLPSQYRPEGDVGEGLQRDAYRGRDPML